MAVPKEQTESSTRRSRSAQRPAPSVNMEELRELIALLRDNGLAELELENEGFRVRLRRESGGGSSYIVDPAPPAPAPAAAPAAVAAQGGPAHPGTQATTAASQDQDLHIIPSPIVGTFYRSPSPNAEAFVKIGSNVEPESVVCIIEA